MKHILKNDPVPRHMSFTSNISTICTYDCMLEPEIKYYLNINGPYVTSITFDISFVFTTIMILYFKCREQN